MTANQGVVSSSPDSVNEPSATGELRAGILGIGAHGIVETGVLGGEQWL